MKSAAAKRPVVRKHTKLRVFWVIVIVLALTGLVWWQVARIVHHRAVEHQREQFVQAEKDLDVLSQSIIAKFGKPYAQQKENSCDYTSAFNEFAAHGDLVCSVGPVLFYREQDVNSAADFARQIALYLKGNTSDISLLDDGRSEHPPVNIGNTRISNDSQLDCGVSYVFYDAASADLYKIPKPIPSSGIISAMLSCGARPAKAQFYPISNN